MIARIECDTLLEDREVLSEEEARLLERRYLREETYEEISADLDISEVAARQRTSRALRRARRNGKR